MRRATRAAIRGGAGPGGVGSTWDCPGGCCRHPGCQPGTRTWAHCDASASGTPSLLTSTHPAYGCGCVCPMGSWDTSAARSRWRRSLAAGKMRGSGSGRRAGGGRPRNTNGQEQRRCAARAVLRLDEPHCTCRSPLSSSGPPTVTPFMPSACTGVSSGGSLCQLPPGVASAGLHLHRQPGDSHCTSGAAGHASGSPTGAVGAVRGVDQEPSRTAHVG